MSDALLRPSRPGDGEKLKEVWKRSFHDSDGFLSLFFEKHYAPGMATLMEADGKPVSCIFTLSGTDYLEPGKTPRPCAYVYSLGTLPEYRGRGYGARVIRESLRRAFEEDGAEWVTLLPAEPSLYGWYGEILGSVTAFWAREKRLAAAELPALPAEGFQAVSLDAQSYGRLRELLLQGAPHVRFSQKLLEWQQESCRYFGGGLYLLDLDGAAGCAAVETYGDRAEIKELLLPEGKVETAAALLARKHPAPEYLVRTPLFWGGDEGGEVRDFVVAIPRNGGKLPDPEAWWGFVFD